ncbi:MAG: ArnT family glycosyltransferase [Pseudobdellovibrionaceae bacterium]
MSALFAKAKACPGTLCVLGLLVVFFIFVALFRPLLPVDETRYLSVAWEMFSHKSYFLLTNNGEPYHHKPPLLFWLINGAWHIFGVSRAAALVPIFLISAAWLLVMRTLFQTLRPDQTSRTGTLMWFLLGAFPFLIYATMTMFDMMLSVCVGATLIFLYRFARGGLWRDALIGGLAMGVGVLAKGPAILIFLAGPVLAYGWWAKGAEGFVSGKRLAAGFGVMFVMALIPVAFWLIPLFMQADSGFLLNLIWKQSAGRVSGHMSGSHARPFYFYLMLLPVLFLPWLAFPSVFKGMKSVWGQVKGGATVPRFLVSVIVPAFILFSLISGKQPHYLLPLVGPLLLLVFMVAPALSDKVVRVTSVTLLSLLCLAHLVGSYTFLKLYDVDGLIAKIKETPHAALGWSRNYQNELGFLARLDMPVTNLENKEARKWLEDHPGSLLVYRRSLKRTDLAGIDCFYNQAYRHKVLGLCVLVGDPIAAKGREEK